MHCFPTRTQAQCDMHSAEERLKQIVRTKLVSSPKMIGKSGIAGITGAVEIIVDVEKV